MAPVSGAAFEGEGPNLRLIVEKGPRSSKNKAFDLLPGSKYQIGREEGGDGICIKDKGISSKHALIQFRSSSLPDPAQNCYGWTISDLASMNGTILNDVQLEASEPCVLSDGDVIKIGERTSIRVRFAVVAGKEDEGNNGKGRRNTRRAAATRGKSTAELVVIDEDAELESAVEDKLGDMNNLRGKAGNGKEVALGNEGGEMEKEGEGKVCGRRTRGSYKVLENSCEKKGREMENVRKVCSRRTRNSLKEEVSKALDIGEERIPEEAEIVRGVMTKDGKDASVKMGRSSQKEENSRDFGNGEQEMLKEVGFMREIRGRGGRNTSVRRTRSSKEEEKLEGLDNLHEDGNEDKGPNLMKAAQKVGVRTRSSRKEENIGDMEVDFDIIEGRRTRKGTTGKRNLQKEIPEEGKLVEELNERCEGDTSKLEEDGIDGLVKDEVNLGGQAEKLTEELSETCEVETAKLQEHGVEGNAGLASSSGVKGSTVGGDEQEVIDLEKMTLGEWFDYLEVSLPKQIIDVTEEMILEMRHKAEKLHEFMLQQMNA